MRLRRIVRILLGTLLAASVVYAIGAAEGRAPGYQLTALTVAAVLLAVVTALARRDARRIHTQPSGADK